MDLNCKSNACFFLSFYTPPPAVAVACLDRTKVEKVRRERHRKIVISGNV